MGMKKIAEISFEDKAIRKFEKDGEIWVSALDVCIALEYKNPAQTLSNTLTKNRDRFTGYTMELSNHVKRGKAPTYFNMRGIIAFCMLSTQPKAIPFQRWADNVLAREIANIPGDIRLEAKRRRIEFTDTLNEHGIKKPMEYAKITNGMKDNLKIERKPKSEYDLIELVKTAAAEMLAKANIMIQGADGYNQVKPICDNSAATIAAATSEKQITENRQ